MRIIPITPLNNMTEYARQIHPWFSWHWELLSLLYIVFLSIYDTLIVEKNSHVPPTPTVVGLTLDNS